MYLEQRHYRFHPGRMPLWLDAYASIAAPTNARHIPGLMGFFTVEVGDFNSVLFHRGWDDIDSRAPVLAARDADPDWLAFRKRSSDIGALASQSVKMLKTVAFSPVTTAQGFTFARQIGGTGMLVDHRTYDLHPGKMAAWLKLYEEQGLPVQRRILGQLLMFAVTEIGPINQAVYMWAFESFGDRERRRAEMAKDPAWLDFVKASGALGALKKQTVMGLKPTAFSAIR